MYIIHRYIKNMDMSMSPIIPIGDEFFDSIILSVGSSYQKPLDGLMTLFLSTALNNFQLLLCGVIRQPLHDGLI